MLLPVQFIFGQSNYASKIAKANDHLNKYLQQVRFEDGMTDEAIQAFNDLFELDSRILFDIPFRDTQLQNTEIKRISKDDRQQVLVVNVYGKMVSVDLYSKIVKRELNDKAITMSELNYTFNYSGKKDSSKVEYDTIIYEVSKQFYDNSWSIATNVKYLVSIRFENGNPLIYNIRRNEEKTTELDLLFTLVDLSTGRKNADYHLPGVTASFRIGFEEKINNIKLKSTTDSIGQIRFEKKVSKRSMVYLDTVLNTNGIRFEIPYDWKNDGKKVSEQPIDGFTIGLRPYKWNGLTYSFLLSGGAFIPEEVNMTNFEEGSSFTSDIGYKAGLAFNLSYFFNHTQLKYNRNKWLFGIGSGIGVNYQRSEINSERFEQKWYDYIDNVGDPCKITFKGQSFKENMDLLTLTMPLFFDFRKRMSNKFSFALKFGANFSIPVSSSYDAKGTFSRWGYYSINDYELPIKDDDVLNYFTEDIINFKGEIEYSNPLAEGFFKLNGFFHIFKNNPDNSLEIGLEFAMPFTSSSSFAYPESKNPSQVYENYFINVENNEYRSLAYATEKIYQYYFGISIGINLVKYRPR